jgi:hypothetical protein
MMNIIDCLDDKKLFAPHFKGTSWTSWKAFLRALFALPMDEAEIAFYQAHTGRTEAPTTPFKGSRSGLRPARRQVPDT